MITPTDIQLPRSPRNLREFVTRLKDSVQADGDELHRGILRMGFYKLYLDELVPLSCFAILNYPDNYQIQPILGNQGYDAVVFNEFGKKIDHIEITTPRDGAEEAIDARLVVARGYGRFHVGDPGEDFDALIPQVVETCRKKSQKDYNDCALVISIAPRPPFDSFAPRYEEQIVVLVRKLENIKFKAKRVFLLILPDRLIEITNLARALDTGRG